MCSPLGWSLKWPGASSAQAGLAGPSGTGSLRRAVLTQLFPGVRAEQGEPTSTGSSTFSDLPAATCLPSLTSWSLRKQGYLCPGFSFGLGPPYFRQLLKSWVLKGPSPPLPVPPGVVLPAAALACTRRPRGSPSVPTALTAAVLFSDPPPKLFLLPSQPAFCPVYFCLFPRPRAWFLGFEGLLLSL